MKDSFFYPPADKVGRIAMVYVQKDGKLLPASGSILAGDPAKYRKGSVFPAPGWGLYSTAEDLLHLYRMMLDGGLHQGRRYLSPVPPVTASDADGGSIRRAFIRWVGCAGPTTGWRGK